MKLARATRSPERYAKPARRGPELEVKRATSGAYGTGASELVLMPSNHAGDP